MLTAPLVAFFVLYWVQIMQPQRSLPYVEFERKIRNHQKAEAVANNNSNVTANNNAAHFLMPY